MIPALSLILAFTATPTPVEGPFDYDMVTVAPRVYVFIEKRLNPIVSSNIVVVVGDTSALVFDTGHHPTTTRQITGDIKRLTDKPVHWVVVSHWHDDHFAGNAQFAEAYPGVQIVAHEFTSQLMDSRRDLFRGEQCKKDIAGDGESLRKSLANGKRPDGTPIPDAARQRATNFLEAIDAHMVECDRMTYRGVDRTLRDSLVIDLGGRTVRLAFLGRGNTAGDVVAFIPDVNTLLAGDLVVFPFPFSTESYITEWAATLRRVEQMQPARIVPGHGPVETDLHYVRDVAETLESISEQAHAAYRDGMTTEQLREKIDLATFAERFSHGDAFTKANFDAQMKGSSVERMWQELTGKWKPEGE